MIHRSRIIHLRDVAEAARRAIVDLRLDLVTSAFENVPPKPPRPDEPRPTDETEDVLRRLASAADAMADQLEREIAP